MRVRRLLQRKRGKNRIFSLPSVSLFQRRSISPLQIYWKKPAVPEQYGTKGDTRSRENPFCNRKGRRCDRCHGSGRSESRPRQGSRPHCFANTKMDSRLIRWKTRKLLLCDPHTFQSILIKNIIPLLDKFSNFVFQ